jgi:hypothetical protein
MEPLDKPTQVLVFVVEIKVRHCPKTGRAPVKTRATAVKINLIFFIISVH